MRKVNYTSNNSFTNNNNKQQQQNRKKKTFEPLNVKYDFQYDELIDIGLNITSRRFNRDSKQVIERGGKANVGAMIITGLNVKECKVALDYVKQYYNNNSNNNKNNNVTLRTTIGVHPHNAKQCNDNTMNELRSMVEANRDICVAIGECGLDYNRNFSPQNVQKKYFEEQVIVCSIYIIFHLLFDIIFYSIFFFSWRNH